MPRYKITPSAQNTDELKIIFWSDIKSKQKTGGMQGKSGLWALVVGL